MNKNQNIHFVGTNNISIFYFDYSQTTTFSHIEQLFSIPTFWDTGTIAPEELLSETALMRFIIQIILAIGLLALTGCGANGSAEGDTSERNSFGHVKIGMPF